MNEIVEQALPLWGLSGSDYHLIAARENEVFRVATAQGGVAMRLHRKGYRTDQELRSELAWMTAVEKGGINVPAPVPSASGEMLHVVGGVQADVLTWLNGVSVMKRFETLDEKGRAELFHEVGRQLARLHNIIDAWIPPAWFTRCAWDRDGLLGDAPLWGRFWENPLLEDEDRQLFVEMRRAATADLQCLESSLDYGLIHADLVSENVMIDENRIQLIDFDDGGFGFRMFEIATALVKYRNERDFPALKVALTKGYQSVRPIDLAQLDLFMAIRAATYVGWNIERINEDGAEKRNARLITDARDLAWAYLGK
ncbi:MAG: phosphotransferase [Paracoccaceae bacterium]|jgi:Ser/Thr protein kinase RdoA (MazF antagonist)|nr:phosphotransferase [Paracoccaceae bacterium]